MTIRSAKALDRHSAKLCVLARDVDSDEYKTLVTALCKEGNVPLLYIDSREKLGEFVGLAKVRPYVRQSVSAPVGQGASGSCSPSVMRPVSQCVRGLGG